MNLARKYRPRHFNEIVGQEHVTKTILNSLKKDFVSHAFLFCGVRGTGKTSIARLLAKSLNCLNPQDGELCNECEMCLSANQGRLVDLIEIDAASHTGVDNVRELIDKMQFQPTMAKRKIHIIDEVHMLSRGAFNALLKTLEEPPEHVYFILATTERHKIPDTIQSRCQIFNFKHLSKNEIAGRLQELCDKEQVETDRDALLMIANEAGGSMRDAIFLLEQYSGEGKLDAKILAKELGLAPQTSLENLYQLLIEKNTKEAIELVTGIANEGFSLSNFSKSFLSFLRDQMLEMVEADKKEELPDILEKIRIFSRAHVDLKSSVIPTLPLEVAIVSVIEESEQDKKEEKSGGWFSFGAKKQETTKKKEAKQEVKEKNEEQVKTAENTEEKEKTEEKSAVFEAPEINFESVQKLWPNIIDKIPSPGVKMALKQAKIISADHEKLILGFSANLFKERLDTPLGNKEFITVFEEFFKTPIKLETKIERISLEPTENTEEKDDEKLTGKDLGDAVEEIFSNPGA